MSQVQTVGSKACIVALLYLVVGFCDIAFRIVVVGIYMRVSQLRTKGDFAFRQFVGNCQFAGIEAAVLRG